MSRSQKRIHVAAGLGAAIATILWNAAGAEGAASLAGSKVDNFMLADQTGMATSFTTTRPARPSFS